MYRPLVTLCLLGYGCRHIPTVCIVNKKDRHHRVGPFCLARLKEFESPTFRLGGGCSILLSYKRISTG